MISPSITPTQSTIDLHEQISALSLDDAESIWRLKPHSTTSRYTFEITLEKLPSLNMRVNIGGQSYGINTEFEGKTENDSMFYNETQRHCKETMETLIKAKSQRYITSLANTIDTKQVESLSELRRLQSRLKKVKKDSKSAWKYTCAKIRFDSKHFPKELDDFERYVNCSAETARAKLVEEADVDFDDDWDIKFV
ncbi:hypothetical protein I302_101864 [Kwoniella bestiolae CBS 10118]|uniref:Uncharacterized protein n=1 Tax=Kwoniella bestiolae CBS 10118 TaxID=1296100 RepID=A0A1B9GDG5_9TREE|nr:hypothetical protein I302_00543 [Kwoniella bestiolae CBS 10118]OCF29052.1 hypothetical protein I302_00543 [Kwoniella bestiolae CBS 10118]